MMSEGHTPDEVRQLATDQEAHEVEATIRATDNSRARPLCQKFALVVEHC